MSIKVGDLVAVIHWPCCNGDIGLVFNVTGLKPATGVGGYCSHCGDRSKHSTTCQNAINAKGSIFPVHWLKRIPPLDELEKEQERKEIAA
jgi:hypothetical protein